MLLQLERSTVTLWLAKMGSSLRIRVTLQLRKGTNRGGDKRAVVLLTRQCHRPDYANRKARPVMKMLHELVRKEESPHEQANHANLVISFPGLGLDTWHR
jgi:hypothetical protein